MELWTWLSDFMKKGVRLEMSWKASWGCAFTWTWSRARMYTGPSMEEDSPREANKWEWWGCKEWSQGAVSKARWTGAGPGFPGRLVVKNPSRKAGDTGSMPGPGRFHMPRGNEACAPQQEKMLQWESYTPQWESSPHSLQIEKSPV